MDLCGEQSRSLTIDNSLLKRRRVVARGALSPIATLCTVTILVLQCLTLIVGSSAPDEAESDDEGRSASLPMKTALDRAELALSLLSTVLENAESKAANKTPGKAKTPVKADCTEESPSLVPAQPSKSPSPLRLRSSLEQDDVENSVANGEAPRTAKVGGEAERDGMKSPSSVSTQPHILLYRRQCSLSDFLGTTHGGSPRSYLRRPLDQRVVAQTDDLVSLSVLDGVVHPTHDGRSSPVRNERDARCAVTQTEGALRSAFQGGITPAAMSPEERLPLSRTPLFAATATQVEEGGQRSSPPSNSRRGFASPASNLTFKSQVDWNGHDAEVEDCGGKVRLLRANPGAAHAHFRGTEPRIDHDVRKPPAWVSTRMHSAC